MIPNVASRSHRGAELLGLVSFALALMLLIALATFDPRDPAPFFRAGAEGDARNFIGPFGAFLAELLIPQLFGLSALLMPIALGLVGWKLFWCRPIEAPYTKAVGNVFVLLALAALLSLTFGTVVFEGEPVRAGGATGEVVAGLLLADFGRAGAYIVAATALFVSLILSTQFSFSAFLKGSGGRVGARLRALQTAFTHYRENRRKEKMRREVIRKHALSRDEPPKGLPRIRRVKGAEDEEPEPEDAPQPEADDLPLQAAAAVVKPAQKQLPFLASRNDTAPLAEPEPEAAAPRRRRRGAADDEAPATPQTRGSYTLPPLTILDAAKPGSPLDNDRLLERGKILQAKSAEFGVMGTVREIHPGPVVTTYEFKPDAGVKYSKIVGLADDLALALEAESIRIDRVSGKGNVGIEIPNETRETIYLREVMESDVFRRASGRLTLGLGKAVNGDVWATDLANMPHLLIAGSTGTGKSVGLNCMIASILFRSTPDEVRMILIDPKRLELGVYEDIPHLLTPVVTDAKVAANVLKWAVAEMERRIRMLATRGRAQHRAVQQHHPRRHQRARRRLRRGAAAAPLRGDRDRRARRPDDGLVARRRGGDHAPRADGARRRDPPDPRHAAALGRRDHRPDQGQLPLAHLVPRGGARRQPHHPRLDRRRAAARARRHAVPAARARARLVRVHGAYVTEHEIARLTSFLRKQGRPSYDDSVGKPEKSSEAAEVTDRDELFDEAARFVVQSGQASTSMLQRRFRIGFSRAGRLVDMMERDGIIGPADGSKPREILVAKDYYETVDTWQR